MNPAEALTREQAVTAYTYGSAYAEFTEREKGREELKGTFAQVLAEAEDISQSVHQKLTSAHLLLANGPCSLVSTITRPAEFAFTSTVARPENP